MIPGCEGLLKHGESRAEPMHCVSYIPSISTQYARLLTGALGPLATWALPAVLPAEQTCKEQSWIIF